MLAGTVAGLATSSVLAPAAAASTQGRPAHVFPNRPTSFVTTRGGDFLVAGKKFRFCGTNTYYLHQQSHYMIDAALDDAFAMALPVVRAWAFADGSGGTYVPLQPEPFVYDNAAFERWTTPSTGQANSAFD